MKTFKELLIENEKLERRDYSNYGLSKLNAVYAAVDELEKGDNIGIMRSDYIYAKGIPNSAIDGDLIKGKFISSDHRHHLVIEINGKEYTIENDTDGGFSRILYFKKKNKEEELTKEGIKSGLAAAALGAGLIVASPNLPSGKDVDKNMAALMTAKHKIEKVMSDEDKKEFDMNWIKMSLNKKEKNEKYNDAKKSAQDILNKYRK